MKRDSGLMCNKHSVIIVTAAAKSCPECGKREISTSFSRCSRCAKKSNKCSLCDGPIK